MSVTDLGYQTALDFLFGRLDYERTPQRARSIYDFKLTRMQRLLELLGNPHTCIPVVHVAGTKGKGSTATMVARVLEESGYRTGLFTSPHMVRFEERMTVNGREPDPRELTEMVAHIQSGVAELDRDEEFRGPTFFELSTALGWFYFLSQQATIAVLEVGLGGRLDSTNLCAPVVTAITSISRDHTRLLGETLEAIAAEKAGIIKHEVPVVVGRMPDGPLEVISRMARERNAPRFALGHEFQGSWRAYDKRPWKRPARYKVSITSPSGHIGYLPLSMPGEHQAINGATALGIVQQLRQAGYTIPDEAVARGLARAQCPLRTEVVGERPLLIVDAAHNEASIAALCRTLSEVQARNRVVIFAASKDKDVRAMLSLVGDFADVLILTRYLNNPRAVPLDELREMAQEMTTRAVLSAESPREALELARRQTTPDDLICVTGSFFLAAEMRELCQREDATSTSRLG